MQLIQHQITDTYERLADTVALIMAYAVYPVFICTAGLIIAIDPTNLVLAQSANDTISHLPSGIYSDTTLRAWAVIGSVMGSMLAVTLGLYLKPPTSASDLVARVWAKAIASACGGVLFAPLVMRQMGMALEVDHVLTVSGTIALLTVGVLHKILPRIEDAAANTITTKFPIDNKTKE